MHILQKLSQVIIRYGRNYTQIQYQRILQVCYCKRISSSKESGAIHQFYLNMNNPYVDSKRYLHGDNEIDSELQEQYDDPYAIEYEEALQQQILTVRNILFPNTKDPIIKEFNECASLQDVLDVVHENKDSLQCEHIVQAVLVLWDIQKIFYQVNSLNDISYKDPIIQNYIGSLIQNSEFQNLLNLIKYKCEEFNVEFLSCILLYLSKMGIDIKDEVPQLLIERFLQILPNNFTLSACSRFMVAIFCNKSLIPVLIAQNVIEEVVKQLENCETVNDFKLVTICLNNAHELVSRSLLIKYRSKLQEFIDKDMLSHKDSRTILKILLFLSYPSWREENCSLISKCVLLLQNNLNLLKVSELLVLYETFQKQQEPAAILNELKRCTSTMLIQLDDEVALPVDIKTKLLSSVVCFSSASQRQDHENLIRKHSKKCMTEMSLTELHRMLTFVKTSDDNLCRTLWNNVIKLVELNVSPKQFDLVLKMCYKYLNFNNDVENYRHYAFEKQMSQLIENKWKTGIGHLMPTRICTMAAFMLAYSKNEEVVDDLVQKIANNWEQLNPTDCLIVAKGLRTAKDIKKVLDPSQIMVINTVLDKCVNEKLLLNTIDTKTVNTLLKTCLYRMKSYDKMMESVVLKYNSNIQMSSKAIKSTAFCLQSTNTLLPTIIEDMTKYVVDFRDNILGSTVEKIAYLCYYLGYQPKNSNKFFDTIIDIIIREKERMSGLSYLQASLSLCFFNKLPESFIQQIFNVSFLEKLDSELANCYSKDTYPVRVRRNMMQLNRAVCLDYPQSNVPWFHQKYIQQMLNKATTNRATSLKNEFAANVYEYLSKTLKNTDCIVQDFIAPYGYHIDFVINFDESEHSQGNINRVGVLLTQPNAYTRMNVQLKGQHQLKQRHLEILGFRIISVNFSYWKTIIYGEEKIKYLTNLLWPDSLSQSYVVNK